VQPDWTQLYRLQDGVLACLNAIEHGFYLSGGTALARGYFAHRYSEDLDFFVNDCPEFELWRDRCLDAIRGHLPAGQSLEILLREARFGRAVVHGPVDLKVEFINDVPSRVGAPWLHPQLGPLDTKENILANKISALVDRGAPKDAADIFWLCCRDSLDIRQALEHATGKAAGLFPPLVAKCLSDTAARGLPPVWWVTPPLVHEFREGLLRLSEALLGL
jgi:hypothetical protein